MLEDLRRVAALFGARSITQARYDGKEDKRIRGRFASRTISRKLGGWHIALERAGLEQNRTPMNVPDESLFKNLMDVWINLGRQPAISEMEKPRSRYSGTTYENRFHGWRNALEAFVSFVNSAEGISGNNEGTEQIQSQYTDAGPRNPGRKLILQVVMRDNGICQICKRAFTENGPDYHIDHIIPWIKGGPTVLSNLQLLCSKCNLLKGDLDLKNSTEE